MFLNKRFQNQAEKNNTKTKIFKMEENKTEKF